jgi:hypothetical protein
MGHARARTSDGIESHRMPSISTAPHQPPTPIQKKKHIPHRLRLHDLISLRPPDQKKKSTDPHCHHMHGRSGSNLRALALIRTGSAPSLNLVSPLAPSRAASSPPKLGPNLPPSLCCCNINQDLMQQPKKTIATFNPDLMQQTKKTIATPSKWAHRNPSLLWHQPRPSATNEKTHCNITPDLMQQTMKIITTSTQRACRNPSLLQHQSRANATNEENHCNINPYLMKHTKKAIATWWGVEPRRACRNPSHHHIS